MHVRFQKDINLVFLCKQVHNLPSYAKKYVVCFLFFFFSENPLVEYEIITLNLLLYLRKVVPHHVVSILFIHEKLLNETLFFSSRKRVRKLK